jgi:hypothetical protein
MEKKGVKRLGKTSNALKEKWNSAHYTQVKIHADPTVATAFKENCVANGLSMAGEISKFMAEYGSSAITKRSAKDPLATRPRRRALLKELICRLEQIQKAEEEYRDNIPENLQASMRYEIAEQSITGLEEAIETLSAVY